MNQLHPTARQCQTPRGATYFVKKYIENGNYMDYNFWHTPKGVVIFRKDKDKDGDNVFYIRSPGSTKWISAKDVREFVLLTSEILAIAFGWRKENVLGKEKE